MKKLLISLIPALLIMNSCTTQEKINYPETRKTDTVDVYFGTEVADPYRWLEDDNSEETAAWVKAQNEVTDAYLAKIPFRNQIRERLTELWNYPRTGVPFHKGNHYFFFKNDGIQNQSVLYIQDSLTGEPGCSSTPTPCRKTVPLHWEPIRFRRMANTLPTPFQKLVPTGTKFM